RHVDIRDAWLRCWSRRELDRLELRIKSLPGGIIGALVRENLCHPCTFHAHLKLGVVLALGLRACLDPECCQRIKVWAPDAKRSGHEGAIPCPLIRLQAPVSRKP